MDYDYSYGTTSYDFSAGDAAAGLLAGGLGIGMMIVWLVVVLVITVFGIYLTYRLVKKMGYAWWMVLLIMFFQPIMLIYFAFAKWPIEAKVEQLQGGRKE